MDSVNWFETKTTHTAARIEWLIGLVAASTLAIIHFGEINWPLFIGLFLVIDVIGYVPGAIAWHRSPTKKISKGYYVAYNVMHSLITASVIAGMWTLVFGAEWALLALPVHLLGDRSLFGNSMKPFGVSFEPKKLGLFEEFENRYQAETATKATRVRETSAF